MSHRRAGRRPRHWHPVSHSPTDAFSYDELPWRQSLETGGGRRRTLQESYPSSDVDGLLFGQLDSSLKISCSGRRQKSCHQVSVFGGGGGVCIVHLTGQTVRTDPRRNAVLVHIVDAAAEAAATGRSPLCRSPSPQSSTKVEGQLASKSPETGAAKNASTTIPLHQFTVPAAHGDRFDETAERLGPPEVVHTKDATWRRRWTDVDNDTVFVSSRFNGRIFLHVVGTSVISQSLIRVNA